MWLDRIVCTLWVKGPVHGSDFTLLHFGGKECSGIGEKHDFKTFAILFIKFLNKSRSWAIYWERKKKRQLVPTAYSKMPSVVGHHTEEPQNPKPKATLSKFNFNFQLNLSLMSHRSEKKQCVTSNQQILQDFIIRHWWHLLEFFFLGGGDYTTEGPKWQQGRELEIDVQKGWVNLFPGC